jgi:hypothetical protein
LVRKKKTKKEKIEKAETLFGGSAGGSRWLLALLWEIVCHFNAADLPSMEGRAHCHGRRVLHHRGADVAALW